MTSCSSRPAARLRAAGARGRHGRPARRRRVRGAVRGRRGPCTHATDIAQRHRSSTPRANRSRSSDGDGKWARVSASRSPPTAPRRRRRSSRTPTSRCTGRSRTGELATRSSTTTMQHWVAVARSSSSSRCASASPRDELRVLYQPIVDADNGDDRGLRGARALGAPRFRARAAEGVHPDRRGEPVSSSTSARGCSQQACHEPRHGWRSRPDRQLGIAVNVSSRQIASRRSSSSCTAPVATNRARPAAADPRAHRVAPSSTTPPAPSSCYELRGLGLDISHRRLRHRLLAP